MTIMTGVSEYAEGFEVELVQTNGRYKHGVQDSEREGSGRWVVRAKNEGGYNCTEVDILDLVDWLRQHRPDLLETPNG